MHVRLREREVVPRQHEWDRAGWSTVRSGASPAAGVPVPADDPAYRGLGTTDRRDTRYAEEASYA
jgi:hypothetical protein